MTHERARRKRQKCAIIACVTAAGPACRCRSALLRHDCTVTHIHATRCVHLDPTWAASSGQSLVDIDHCALQTSPVGLWLHTRSVGAQGALIPSTVIDAITGKAYVCATRDIAQTGHLRRWHPGHVCSPSGGPSESEGVPRQRAVWVVGLFSLLCVCVCVLGWHCHVWSRS